MPQFIQETQEALAANRLGDKLQTLQQNKLDKISKLSATYGSDSEQVNTMSAGDLQYKLGYDLGEQVYSRDDGSKFQYKFNTDGTYAHNNSGNWIEEDYTDTNKYGGLDTRNLYIDDTKQGNYKLGLARSDVNKQVMSPWTGKPITPAEARYLDKENAGRVYLGGGGDYDGTPGPMGVTPEDGFLLDAELPTRVANEMEYTTHSNAGQLANRAMGQGPKTAETERLFGAGQTEYTTPNAPMWNINYDTAKAEVAQGTVLPSQVLDEKAVYEAELAKLNGEESSLLNAAKGFAYMAGEGIANTVDLVPEIAEYAYGNMVGDKDWKDVEGLYNSEDSEAYKEWLGYNEEVVNKLGADATQAIKQAWDNGDYEGVISVLGDAVTTPELLATSLGYVAGIVMPGAMAAKVVKLASGVDKATKSLMAADKTLSKVDAIAKAEEKAGAGYKIAKIMGGQSGYVAEAEQFGRDAEALYKETYGEEMSTEQRLLVRPLGLLYAKMDALTAKVIATGKDPIAKMIPSMVKGLPDKLKATFAGKVAVIAGVPITRLAGAFGLEAGTEATQTAMEKVAGMYKQGEVGVTDVLDKTKYELGGAGLLGGAGGAQMAAPTTAYEMTGPGLAGVVDTVKEKVKTKKTPVQEAAEAQVEATTGSKEQVLADLTAANESGDTKAMEDALNRGFDYYEANQDPDVISSVVTHLEAHNKRVTELANEVDTVEPTQSKLHTMGASMDDNQKQDMIANIVEALDMDTIDEAKVGKLAEALGLDNKVATEVANKATEINRIAKLTKSIEEVEGDVTTGSRGYVTYFKGLQKAQREGDEKAVAKYEEKISDFIESQAHKSRLYKKAIDTARAEVQGQIDKGRAEDRDAIIARIASPEYKATTKVEKHAFEVNHKDIARKMQNPNYNGGAFGVVSKIDNSVDMMNKLVEKPEEKVKQGKELTKQEAIKQGTAIAAKFMRGEEMNADDLQFQANYGPTYEAILAKFQEKAKIGTTEEPVIEGLDQDTDVQAETLSQLDKLIAEQEAIVEGLKSNKVAIQNRLDMLRKQLNKQTKLYRDKRAEKNATVLQSIVNKILSILKSIQALRTKFKGQIVQTKAELKETELNLKDELYVLDTFKAEKAELDTKPSPQEPTAIVPVKTEPTEVETKQEPTIVTPVVVNTKPAVEEKPEVVEPTQDTPLEYIEDMKTQIINAKAEKQEALKELNELENNVELTKEQNSRKIKLLTTIKGANQTIRDAEGELRAIEKQSAEKALKAAEEVAGLSDKLEAKVSDMRIDKLTAKAKEALAQMVANIDSVFKSAIPTDIKMSKDILEKEDPSRLLLVDGSYPQRVKEAIALEILRYTQRLPELSKNDDIQIAKMLGFNNDTWIPKEVREQMADIGRYHSLEVAGLGRDIAKSIGISVNENEEYGSQERLESALGTIAIRLLEEMNYVTYDNKTFTQDKRQAMVTAIEYYNSGNSTSIRENAGIDSSDKVVAMIKVDRVDAIESANMNKESVEQLGNDLERDGAVKGPSFRKPEKDREHTVRGMENETSIPEAEQKVLNKMEKEAWTTDDAGIDIVREWMTNEEDAKKFKKAMGYNDEYTETVHGDLQYGVQAKNEKIERSINDLLEFADEAKSKPFWFKWFFSKSGRFFMDSVKINPQTDKLHRFLMHTGKAKLVKTAEQLEEFKLAVVQAFDGTKLVPHADDYSDIEIDGDTVVDLGSIDKQSKEASLAQFEEINKVVQNSSKDQWIDLIAGADHPAHTISALLALQKYSSTRPFYSNLQLETDAVTSGFILNILTNAVMPLDKIKKWAAKGGVWIGGTDAKSYGEYSEGSLDSYQEGAQGVAELVDGMNTAKARAAKWIVGEVSRAFMKSPFMVFIYGASPENIAKNIGREYADKMLNELSNPDTVVSALTKVGQTAKALGVNQSTLLPNGVTSTVMKKAYDGNVEAKKLITKLFRETSIQFGGPTANIHKMIADTVSSVHGEAVKNYLSEEFKEIVGIKGEDGNKGTPGLKQVLNKTFQFMFTDFKAEYDRRVKPGMSKAEVDKVYQEMVDAGKVPGLFTVLSDTNNNREKTPIVKKGKIQDKAGNYNATVKVNKEDGKRTSRTVNPLIRELIEAPSSGAVLNIHWLDGGIISQLLADSRALGVHDATVQMFGEAVKNASKYNKTALEHTMQLNMLDQVVIELGKIKGNYKGLRDIKAMASKLAKISKANKSVIQAGRVDVEHMSMPGSKYSYGNGEVSRPTEVSSTEMKAMAVKEIEPDVAKATTKQVDGKIIPEEVKAGAEKLVENWLGNTSNKLSPAVRAKIVNTLESALNITDNKNELQVKLLETISKTCK